VQLIPTAVAAQYGSAFEHDKALQVADIIARITIPKENGSGDATFDVRLPNIRRFYMAVRDRLTIKESLDLIYETIMKDILVEIYKHIKSRFSKVAFPRLPDLVASILTKMDRNDNRSSINRAATTLGGRLNEGSLGRFNISSGRPLSWAFIRSPAAGGAAAAGGGGGGAAMTPAMLGLPAAAGPALGPAAAGPALSAFGTGPYVPYTPAAAGGAPAPGIFADPKKYDENLITRALKHANIYESANEVKRNINSRDAASVRSSLNRYEEGLAAERLEAERSGKYNSSMGGGRRRSQKKSKAHFLAKRTNRRRLNKASFTAKHRTNRRR
jgi:hypothetical protein